MLKLKACPKILKLKFAQNVAQKAELKNVGQNAEVKNFGQNAEIKSCPRCLNYKLPKNDPKHFHQIHRLQGQPNTNCASDNCTAVKTALPTLLE